MASTRTISVSGMSCDHCEQTVEDALLSVPGVESVTVDRESGSATVAGDADVSSLVAAVDDAGYEASA
ncbi:CopZ family metallochaperone [Halobellus sp. GM3]|uniref:CopZ family metallochaperone n=1 Tax=Halobellus sp. GM3 TaxID=3458410 RepID=UPI00403E08D7